MKAPRIKSMSLEQLVRFRDRINETLSAKATEQKRTLEAQLSRLDGFGNKRGRPPSRRGKSSLRGRKLEAKYRGPKGETWAGRGMRPAWLTALLKKGRKLDEFAVRKAAGRAK